MDTFTFGFLGCGNMGGALALAAAKALSADSIAVCDRDSSKTKLFSGKATAVCSSELAQKSRFIFLGVKPQVLSTALAEIKDIFSARQDRFVLISMAAGKEISAIEKILGFPCPIIRIMPNTPANVNEGMILFSKNELVIQDDIQEFLCGMRYAGRFDLIPENLIDAAGAVSGCGPAFVYLFAEALADAGVECGLPRDKALLYASQTLKGAAEMLLVSGEHPATLKDRVCSPGGTTIAGVHALEAGKFRAAIMNAVTAAYTKTAELKK